MFTTIYLFLIAPILAFLFNLLAAARIWRHSVLGALCVVFRSPLAGLIALIRYWKDPEVRVRFPLIASLLIFGAWWGFLIYGVSEAENEMAHRRNMPHESDAQVQARFDAELSKLPLKSGRVEIAKGDADIDVPGHFRFVPRINLMALYAKFGTLIDKSTSGWIVHESVNLADDDAWFVEVDWHPVGYVDEGAFVTQSSESLLDKGRDNDRVMSERRGEDPDEHRIVRYAEEPALDGEQHSVTWVEEFATTEKDEHRLDCYAVKLTRKGYFMFSITDVAKTRQELCLRTVRLAAARTAPASGKAYADHSSFFDHKAKFDLAAIVTGANWLR